MPEVRLLFRLRLSQVHIDAAIVSGGGESDSESETKRELATHTARRVHDAHNQRLGCCSAAGRVDLQALGEPQGEGVAFADDSTIYLVGEGGGGSRPGTFARLTCTF